MSKRKYNFEVLYIAGNGHSGSTLLDIILGSINPKENFSAGELTFVTRESIFEEICSCQNTIKSCEVWSRVYAEWEERRTISFNQYRQLNHKFDRNINFLLVLKNMLFPSKQYKAYVENTGLLFYSIHLVTGKSTIVDSSKTALRIPVLSKFCNVKVIHICRDFSGVLNSAKRNYKKDIAQGYEVDLKPRKTSKTFLDWILNNVLVVLFSIGQERIKLYYKNYVSDLNCLSRIIDVSRIKKPSFKIKPEHVLAGNVIRLKEELKLNATIGFRYKRLSKKQLLFSRIIDKLFFFWSGSFIPNA